MCNDNSPVPHVSLFSGYDGIGIALKRIFGGHLRTIAYCEREAYPCANLVEKIESKQLDAAPIFTDVHEFPWEQYYPFMANGIMSFGFPCQPVSFAGKRKVVDDERWLFDVCADGIEIMRPGWIFAENVEGLLSAKMPNGKPVIAHIHERLEKMGYIVKTGLFSAAEVGAPHQRKRVFILATLDDSAGRESIINSMLLRQAERKDNVIRCASPPCAELAYTESKRTNGETRSRCKEVGRSGEPLSRETEWPNTGSKELAHAGLLGQTEQKQQTAGVEQQGPKLAHAGLLGQTESKQQATGVKQRGSELADPPSADHQWPARPGEPQYEWEEPRTTAKSGLGGTFNGTPPRMDPNKNRVDRLRLLGNGVVPQTAEKAFITLYEALCN